MKKGGVPDELMDLMDTILRYGGRGVRGPGLYGIEKKDIMSNMKSILTSVQGVSNPCAHGYFECNRQGEAESTISSVLYKEDRCIDGRRNDSHRSYSLHGG